MAKNAAERTIPRSILLLHCTSSRLSYQIINTSNIDIVTTTYISKTPQPIAESLANFGISANIYQIKEQIIALVRLIIRFIVHWLYPVA